MKRTILAVVVAALTIPASAMAVAAKPAQDPVKLAILTANYQRTDPGGVLPAGVDCDIYTHGSTCGEVMIAGRYATITYPEDGPNAGVTVMYNDPTAGWSYSGGPASSQDPFPCTKWAISMSAAKALAMPCIEPFAPSKVATGYSNPRVKPAQINWTGDGSGWYGGRTGHYSEPSRDKSPGTIPDVGHLDWTDYGWGNARATGVVWVTYGPGPTQGERFRIEGTVKIFLFSPNSAGNFKIMTVYVTRAGHKSGQSYHLIDGQWDATR